MFDRPVFPLGLSAIWQDPKEVGITDLRASSWLLDRGSLTVRLSRYCEKVAVSLLGQADLLPQQDELDCLQPCKQWVVREVLLCGDNSPWVFARSVISRHLMTAQLSNLQSTPLGDRLFRGADFQRGSFQVCRMPNDRIPWGRNSQPDLWGRRSVFESGGEQVLVAEIFLAGSPLYWLD